MLRRNLALLSVLAVTALPTFAGITTASYVLSHSNTFSQSTNYGQVDLIADDVAGTITFTVTIERPALYGEIGDNFGIQTFGFNFESLDLPNTAGWEFSGPAWDYSGRNARLDGLGLYDVAITGDGGSRQDPLSFTLQLPDSRLFAAVVGNFAQPNAAGYFFAAHIAGFSAADNIGSHWVAATASDYIRVVPIPAPAALLLGSLGLATLFLGRRYLTA